MYPYWSYFTDGWPQARRSVPQPEAEAGTGAEAVDERLAHLVADRLIAEPAIRGGQLVITVQNRVVILDGRIDSTEAKAAASRQAWSTPGVYDVCNRLVADESAQ